MRLAPGTRVGQYEVTAHIAAGGMGEVYRAHDATLDRDVALKVLPAQLAADPERLARFRREAPVLASLNHKNIAAIYGLEEDEAEGVHALVLELIEGPTLSECIAHGSLELGKADWNGWQRGLTIDESLHVARQLTEALEAAHDQGVIHRDLKPANIKVMPDGTVKVLDFGLAKALSDDSAIERAEDADSSSPTISAMGTRAGVILGTPAYMSPEQARGARVDRRTDIWAFGAVLFEMLTGTQIFAGQTISDTLAAVLRADVDWPSLPPQTPNGIRKLLRLCLEKDAKRRLPHIGSARLELDDVVAATTDETDGTQPPTWKRVLPWAAAGIAVVIAGILTWNLTRPEPEQRVTRLAVSIPQGTELSPATAANIAMSPDGSRLAFTTGQGETARLWIREMDQLEATLVEGSEGASEPFFSPGGQWVAFYAGTELKKASPDGGSPITVVDKGNGSNSSGTWGADDTIVYAQSVSSGLFRISANGGEPEQLTAPDTATNELGHWYPQLLPDGDSLLFTVYVAESLEASHTEVLTLSTGDRRTVHEGATYARYVPTGHLIYPTISNTLIAVPFDLATLEVTGAALPVLEDVVFGQDANSQFSVSDDGALAYVPASALSADQMLVWVDREGTIRPATEERRRYSQPAISPDGQRLAVRVEDARSDIWVLELERGTLTRVTFTEGLEGSPVWTADGERLLFFSEAGGPAFDLFSSASDGSGEAEELYVHQFDKYPTSLSPDDAFLAFVERHSETSFDIWTLPLEQGGELQPFAQTAFDEYEAEFSPDGRWVAYQSNESGRFEIYVQAYPGPGAKTLISTDGGTEPRWTKGGRELVYRNGAQMMAVEIEGGAELTLGTPALLFEGDYLAVENGRNYDVTADGEQFIMIADDPDAAEPQIEVVLNWFEELRERAPLEP